MCWCDLFEIFRAKLYGVSLSVLCFFVCLCDVVLNCVADCVVCDVLRVVVWLFVVLLL